MTLITNYSGFSTVSFYKRTTHELSRTTLPPSSPFRVGKILVYVNTDYHKLHFVAHAYLFTTVVFYQYTPHPELL